jgi:type VI secretion system protein ImpH
MATYGWGEGRSVKDGLFEEAHRFAFLQAVHLLEVLHKDDIRRKQRTAPGEGIDPGRELVHFRHAVRLDFPAGDIENIVRLSPDGTPEMHVNVLGLAGATGPLPHAITELLISRTFRGDDALRDFLDIFNHRLISLLYRARKKYRPALGADTPDSGRMARVLYSFVGLGTPHLANRLDVPDRSLLSHAGVFVDRYRSTSGLVRMLEHAFGVAVDVSPFHGRWETIDDQDVTRLGRRNQRLGDSAVLGGRVWNAAASFEVQLGPLSLRKFLAFLPTGHAYLAVVSAVRFYTRHELGFKLRLALKGSDVPKLRLGTEHGAHLGWTTWLRTRPLEYDTHVTLLGKS